MKNKVHLTREGLDEIKKIKGGKNLWAEKEHLEDGSS